MWYEFPLLAACCEAAGYGNYWIESLIRLGRDSPGDLEAIRRSRKLDMVKSPVPRSRFLALFSAFTGRRAAVLPYSSAIVIVFPPTCLKHANAAAAFFSKTTSLLRTHNLNSQDSSVSCYTCVHTLYIRHPFLEQVLTTPLTRRTPYTSRSRAPSKSQ